MSDKKYSDEINPFDDGLPDNLDIRDVDAMGYGAVDLPESGRIVSKPIDINKIRPDLRQPRRAIPMVVRGAWDGDPDEIEDILVTFHEYAESEYGAIDVKAVLMGTAKKWDVPQEDSTDSPVFKKYALLLTLAGNILNEGLTNPITVVKRGDGYQVETGERRWLAFQILARYIDAEKYGKIPAREVEYDPFRQATENNSRSKLDTIEIARQVAILIMELLDDEHDYTDIEDMVMTGGTDRRYYAQVANGYVHSVPEALRPKIQKAIRGLAWNTISQYRALLALTGDDVVDDALWHAADTFNWSEMMLRELKIPRDWDDQFSKTYCAELRRIVSQDVWDYVDLDQVKKEAVESFAYAKLEKERLEAQKEAEKQQESTPPETLGGSSGTIPVKGESLVGRWVRMSNGSVGRVIAEDGEKLELQLDSGSKLYGTLAHVMAMDVDPVSGHSPDERARTREFFAKPVMVVRDGYKIPGLGHGIVGPDKIKVLLKDGSFIECHVSELEIDGKRVAPNKPSSEVSGSPTPQKTDSKPASHLEAEQLLHKTVLTRSRKRGVVTKVEGEWLTVEFPTGNTQAQHYTTVRIVDASHDSGGQAFSSGGTDVSDRLAQELRKKLSDDAPRFALDAQTQIFFANLLGLARSSGVAQLEASVDSIKGLESADVEAMREAEELHEYLSEIFADMNKLLDWTRSRIEAELGRIEDGA